jgi:hypothetical protein
MPAGRKKQIIPKVYNIRFGQCIAKISNGVVTRQTAVYVNDVFIGYFNNDALHKKNVFVKEYNSFMNNSVKKKDINENTE